LDKIMKISDIVVEAERTEQEKFNRLQSLPGVDPELVRLTKLYMDRQGSEPDYTTALTNASRELLAKAQKEPQKKRQQDPSKLAPKPKDTVARRISQFGTVGTDAASQAKGAIGRAWQRGGRWSRALGVPSPKKK
jgi:hypothetical protein